MNASLYKLAKAAGARPPILLGDPDEVIEFAIERLEQLEAQVAGAMPIPTVGDIVRPREGVDPLVHPLVSGCYCYKDAVVVSARPFVLVSREQDMLWSATVKRSDFLVFGRASKALLKACLKRAKDFVP